MKRCEDSTGKLRCNNCKKYHSYYGCLSVLFGMGFVQSEQSKLNNFVQIDNKESIDK